MKKITLSLITVFFLSNFCQLNAQRSAIGFYGTATEYIGDLNNHNFNSYPLKHNYSLYKFKYFKPGAAISLQQYINASLNLVEMLSYNRLQYQLNRQSVGVDADFVVFNLMLKYKLSNGYLLKVDAPISPFIIGGLGATRINSRQLLNGVEGNKISKGETKANLAIGAGMFFRFNDAFGIEASSIFQRPFYDAWDGLISGGNDIYLQHNLGLIFSLKKPVDTDKDGVPDKKDKCADTPSGITVDSKGCPVDGDGDGVADYIDKCPQQRGSLELAGCPDTDNDDVADIDDKCPTVHGLAKFAGCPDWDNDGVEDSKDHCPYTSEGTPVNANGCPLDSDGDKVPDNLDKCPNTPAGTVVDANGCPLDRDKDGVPNDVDKCPDTPGPATNNGCPRVKEEAKKRLNFATRGIYFETGKAIIKRESFSKLNEIVSIINEYPDYNLRLGGHTDSVGSTVRNEILSQARVDVVKSYLVAKGISEERLQAKGFGESMPIAPNKTAVGRARNRRVEMELYLK
ncbi:MAG: OmpA/MotB domain protein [Segetibacter sp.]|jgi:outer membrane protein OmpA-like peptidoglycan-associated protein|nr:OmpA/MotB domain protein [Segetibacter sp.]